MNLQEAIAIAWHGQVEVFFDIEMGFIKVHNHYRAFQFVWVYFDDLNLYEKAFIFAVSKGFTDKPVYEELFEQNPDGKWWPKE